MAIIADINDTTLTEVLDGAGFCYSEYEIEYYFGADAATAEAAGRILLNPRSQINGDEGKILWAKAVKFETVIVTSTPE